MAMLSDMTGTEYRGGLLAQKSWGGVVNFSGERPSFTTSIEDAELEQIFVA